MYQMNDIYLLKQQMEDDNSNHLHSFINKLTGIIPLLVGIGRGKDDLKINLTKVYDILHDIMKYLKRIDDYSLHRLTISGHPCVTENTNSFTREEELDTLKLYLNQLVDALYNQSKLLCTLYTIVNDCIFQCAKVAYCY